MIDKLEIETRRLQTDIGELQAHLNSMKRTGDSMMGGINALSAMWEGETKEAFTTQFRSDYQTLQEMENVIGELIKDLEQAGKRYQTGENSVGSIIDSIRV